MKKQFNRIEKLKIWILWPFVINVIIALVVAIGSNIFNAKSAFLGGLVAILPQSILGYCSFKFWGALQSKQIWQGFVKGEALKFGLKSNKKDRPSCKPTKSSNSRLKLKQIDGD